ncbi:MAG: 3-deoxy-D-manno-octulosonic acid transferase, partial [Bacteroidetes bacterium]|nr:3-deoxy-D-manno-octulosonic acid transferase [Bacteroidota bacterium]
MALFLYRVFLLLYRAGAWLISPWNAKARQWRQGRRGIWQRLEQALAASGTPIKPLIWFHCASLGEFEQARPLVEKLRETHPGHRILLSFFSPSGYEVKKNYAGADIITYLPEDSPAHARRLLALAKPQLVCWVKYEYWHYYLQEIRRNNVPLLLISGIFRPVQPFFRSWGSFHRNMLACFTHFFVQNEASRELLAGIGIKDTVTVSGDTRFDRVVDIAGQFSPIPLIEQFIGGAPSIVAGSTWDDDEEEMDHYANTHPEIKFIIAPHEIDEEHLKDIEKLFHHTVRYSVVNRETSDVSREPSISSGQRTTVNGQPPNTLIIDNIGLLSRLYHYATITYIGGGFGEDGIHNCLEAAVYGKPVVFGPVYDKYAEAVDLVEEGGAYSIENALELEKTFDELLKDRKEYESACAASRDYVYRKTGATG